MRHAFDGVVAVVVVFLDGRVLDLSIVVGHLIQAGLTCRCGQHHEQTAVKAFGSSDSALYAVEIAQQVGMESGPRPGHEHQYGLLVDTVHIQRIIAARAESDETDDEQKQIENATLHE